MQEEGFEDIEVAPYKKSQEILLDADNVSYNQATGIATANGNVYARNLQTTVRAPYVQYNSKTNIIIAESTDDEDVIVTNLKDRYVGKYFEYNVVTKRGIFTDVHGKADAMVLEGKDVHFLPADEAVAERLVKRKHAGKKAVDNKDVIARWQDVSATSCDFAKPHYCLKTKRAIIIPNRATILKRPKLYMSGHCVFQYPFDHVIKRKGDKLMPELNYTDSKGAGLGLNASKYLGKWGMLNASVSVWTKDIVEASFNYRKPITKNLSAFINVNRFYNSDDKITQWRPEWGLDYHMHGGWKARLYFSERELLSTQMVLGETRRYNVSRKPEFSVTSPWFFKNFQPAKLSFMAMYGSYEDDKTAYLGWTNRALFQAKVSSNFKNLKFFNFLTPFYGGSFMYFRYNDSKDSIQRVWDGWAGVGYKFGAITLSTSYTRRWVYGQSPMSFDRYANNIYLNQTLSFPLPIGPKWSHWRVLLSGYYDFAQDRFPVLNYSLTYNKHCYTWEFWGRREFYGTENLLGLTFYINAFPDKKFNLGSDR